MAEIDWLDVGIPGADVGSVWDPACDGVDLESWSSAHLLSLPSCSER